MKEGRQEETKEEKPKVTVQPKNFIEVMWSSREPSWSPGKATARRKEGYREKEPNSTGEKGRKEVQMERKEPTPIKTSVKRLEGRIREKNMEGTSWKKKGGKEKDKEYGKETPGKERKRTLQAKKDMYLKNAED